MAVSVALSDGELSTGAVAVAVTVSCSAAVSFESDVQPAAASNAATGSASSARRRAAARGLVLRGRDCVDIISITSGLGGGSVAICLSP